LYQKNAASVADPTSAPLDYAERWLLDGLRVLRPPFSALQITADMTQATRRLEDLRRQGVQATSTHLLVHAAARALAANPALHQLIYERGLSPEGRWHLSDIDRRRDWALTSTFATSGVLIGGQIWSRVVAVDGQPAVRPVMTLTLSSDHGVWDGRAVARFLSAVKAELEGP
jgi:pyruvate dehydrogenase E2 component (dihydrolipoamide acetyltransferase)